MDTERLVHTRYKESQNNRIEALGFEIQRRGEMKLETGHLRSNRSMLACNAGDDLHD